MTALACRSYVDAKERVFNILEGKKYTIKTSQPDLIGTIVSYHIGVSLNYILTSYRFTKLVLLKENSSMDLAVTNGNASVNT